MHFNALIMLMLVGKIFLFGLLLKGVGAKDIPFVSNFDGLATVYQNTPDFLAQPGDMVVFVDARCLHMVTLHG